MEKGNLRNPSSSKANSSDGKNKQEGNAKFNRFSRYKESLSPRQDTWRRPNPQKNREAFDKRPRTRSGAFCEKYRNEVVVETLEAGSCNSKQGSKKVSLNHLLNFTLAPVDGRDFSARRPARPKVKLPKYNKELFLQANCQFIARDDGDYSRYCANADTLVDWALIEEIRLPSHEVPSCPICLYPPEAAKITRCGHIYCWACILHYLALTDRSWQKCPICFEAIHVTDLKSVLPITQKVVNVGQKITMCLMRREKGSMFSVPAVMNKSLLSVCSVNDDDVLTRYQKLLLASKAEIQNIIQRERKELEAQLIREQGEVEVCFVEHALKLLHEREELLNSEGHSAVTAEAEQSDASSLAENIPSEIEEAYPGASMEVTTPSSIHEGNFNDMAYSASESSVDARKLCHSASDGQLPENSGTPRKNSSHFYFYQAEDGQHIYLHGLNVRMLVKEYGCLELSPSVIEAEVLALEKISMTEELRKRLRYLQHVPLTCEFQVAELQLKNFLSKSTIQEFAGEVAKRAKMRSQKAQEERKREKHIEIEEKKKLGLYPGATYNLSSCRQFPVCDSRSESKSMDSSKLGSLADDCGDQEYDAQYPTFGVAALSLDSGEESPSTSTPVASFAQMLREGSSSTVQASPSKAPLSFKKPPDPNDDDEDAGTAPEYRLSFGDAIQAALDTAMTNQRDGSDRKTSKRKAKKKILFSTSMCRSK